MAQTLKKSLKDKLKGAKKIAFLGIGSDLRGDDEAGEAVVRDLAVRLKKKRVFPEIKFFFGSTAPENLTGEIKKFSPTHIVIIDSAELGKSPGTTRLVNLKEIGGVSFFTHRLPTKILADYLRKSLKCKVAVIGIQPKSLFFAKSISSEVKKAVKSLSSLLREAIKNLE